MKINNDNISFQSKFKFIRQRDFNKMVASLNKKRHEVGYPWTPDVIKKGKNLYTTKIMDCIAGGIVDGSEVTMFHLCTRNHKEAVRTRQRGFDIERIKRILGEKTNMNSPNLHGFIIGGYNFSSKSKYNVNKLNKIKQFFEENLIPYTIFGGRKDVHYFGKYSIFYSSKEDTWYITHSHTESKGLSEKADRNEIEINGDSLTYSLYPKIHDEKGLKYPENRVKSNVENYFKSQFRDVSISPIDIIV